MAGQEDQKGQLALCSGRFELDYELCSGLLADLDARAMGAAKDPRRPTEETSARVRGRVDLKTRAQS